MLMLPFTVDGVISSTATKSVDDVLQSPATLMISQHPPTASQDNTNAATAPASISPDQRLIVALDMPAGEDAHERAVRLVGKLDNVSFFKIGLGLLVRGDVFGFLKRIQTEHEDRTIFIDLKTGGDIPDIIELFVNHADNLGIRFMTFIEARHTSITRRTLKAGLAARGSGNFPQFICVPMLSTIEWPVERIVASGIRQLKMGFDGLVASGSAVRALREEIPREIPLISPGIRPRGANPDNHVRWTTPSGAIQDGADYLVVGRPILNAPNPRDMAQRIIDEIADTV